MSQDWVAIGVTVITAAILAALFWGYQRQREEGRRRKRGVVTIPVGAGYMVTAGCLGVLGYLGLVSVLVFLTLDLFEQAEDVPASMAWVVAIGLLAGFFAMVAWAVFKIGSSFAVTRLVVDRQAIRLKRRRRLKSVIFWDRPWKLERMARLQQVGHQALGGGTEYSLIMFLRQRRYELMLEFDVTGNEVGGLPAYDGPHRGYHILDQSEWLRSEILFRHEKWDKTSLKKQSSAALSTDEGSALAPGNALKEALNFDEEDLAKNRQGLSSDSQTGSIRGAQKLTLATYLVLGTSFGAGALYCLGRLLQGQAFAAFGPWLIVLLLATGFCLLMVLVTRQRSRSEILVERVSGKIHLQHYQKSDEYWLRIADEAFPITKRLHDALLNDSYYQLYVARYGIAAQEAKLLSAEQLESPHID